MIRKITLEHGRALAQQQISSHGHGALKTKGAATIITEMDGCMIPLVDCTSAKGGDRRRTRNCHWQEMRLCAARIDKEAITRFGVSMGTVEQAGHTWARTVAKANWAIDTHLHVVGDGAAWIAQQCKQCLGGSYLLDLYHVCDYLVAAAVTASTHPRWLEVQKRRLKDNHPERVIEALKPYLEPDATAATDAPVRAAIRYLSNRLDQLDYKTAIEKELPIGSGMIEGGHRHVLQARLKISGAWWTKENAQAIAAIRVCRANEEEASYWKKVA